ncbi:MAG: glycosyltransferase, partial [Woeseiaceae bacterium]
MKIAIVVEAIPPHCGGGEQVAWIHAVELAKNYEVAVVTLGETYSETTQDNVRVYCLPRQKRNLFAYLTTHRALLNRCIDRIAPTVIHCHMPNELAVCLKSQGRLMVSTIHD